MKRVTPADEAVKREEDMQTTMEQDELLKKKIVDQLYADSRVNSAEILVEVRNGRATLAGSIPTYVARGVASDNAWAVSGVQGVDNRLAVLFPETSPPPLDEDLRLTAESALSTNARLDASNLRVSVNEGVVHIKGTVPSYWQARLAEFLVADLKGVRGVENKLAVVPMDSVIDKTLAEAIESSLERSRFISSRNITVRVTNGVVTLTGAVSSERERREASEIASAAFGVVSVHNAIELSPVGIESPTTESDPARKNDHA